MKFRLKQESFELNQQLCVTQYFVWKLVCLSFTRDISRRVIYTHTHLPKMPPNRPNINKNKNVKRIRKYNRDTDCETTKTRDFYKPIQMNIQWNEIN